MDNAKEETGGPCPVYMKWAKRYRLPAFNVARSLESEGERPRPMYGEEAPPSFTE